MLRVEHVDFAYGANAPVLRDVSLEVEPREVVCIVGPNGAGKSTLLRLVAGLLEPQGGSIRCFGEDPATLPRAALARRLSFLPQEYRLTFPFTVAEVVLMGRYPHRRPGLLALESQDDLDRADAAMRRCDVLDLARRRFDELSGGERRRALLAQAFCQETELVLLDEPTSSLDPAHAITVFEALRAETRDRDASALVVTHDLNLAARFADRLIVLHGATVAVAGAPAGVLSAPEIAAAFSCGFHVGTLPGTETPFIVPK